MREALFRVWDKKYKSMDELDGYDLYLADGKIYDVSECSFAYSQYMEKKNVTERYELMQYTGVKDKNGKKIFEGDIIKITYLNDDLSAKREYIRYVEFNLGMFMVTIKGSGVGNSLYSYVTNALQYIIKPQLEVIGNIYENCK